MMIDDEISDPLERQALRNLCAILNEFDAEAKDRLLTWVAWPLEMDKPLRQLRPLATIRIIVEELLRLRADRDAALEREMAAVKGRDAAVAEAVRMERERCAATADNRRTVLQREAQATGGLTSIIFNAADECAKQIAAAIRRGE